MKTARIIGKTVKYYAIPKPTKEKLNRWPIKVGERKCRWKFLARVYKFIYEAI